MAIILRGKHKNKEVEIQQWCNDWVTVSGKDFCKLVSPTSLQYTPEEFREILFHENNGIFFDLYEPDYVAYKFKRRKNK